MVDLVRAGLASAAGERVVGGGKTIEVARMRIKARRYGQRAVQCGPVRDRARCNEKSLSDCGSQCHHWFGEEPDSRSVAGHLITAVRLLRA
jgi:hypothetical protein